MQVNFGNNPIPPDPSQFNLTITMTDSFGDGWNGNILGIKQNNDIVGTFGSTFTSGSSKGPLYVFIKAGISAQIVVSQLGNKTNELGFVVKAPNGTIIYQRTAGTTFTASTVFSTFCSVGGCPPTLLLNITLSDSFGDGWNGNILGIKQNNTIIGTFGNVFTGGSSSGPIYLSVIGNLGAQIVVTQLGNKTNEVGFVIRAPNGTIIYQRANGTAFNSSTIFAAFCPSGGCPNTIDLIITMTDSFGDGWKGNILGLRQNNTIVGTFGSSFTTGFSTDPVLITVKGNL